MTDYPSYLTEEEIKNYFHTILTSFEKEEKKSKETSSKLEFKFRVKIAISAWDFWRWSLLRSRILRSRCDWYSALAWRDHMERSDY